jgi:hypothetical protein
MAGFWRKCRITFRWCRIVVWLLVLAALGSLLWLNRVGLPDFLKTRLVASVREQGVDLQFSRMRLSLIRGVVAEDVRIGGTGPEYAPVFNARLVRLAIDFPALWHRRLALDGLGLHDGAFSLPLSPTNGLTLTNLQTFLRFGTNDTWSLDRFRADFAGMQIMISGEVTHAREALKWKLFAGGETNRGPAFETLKDLADGLKQIQFEGMPTAKLVLSGDARDVHAVALQLAVDAPAVKTPWFAARDFRADFNLTAPADAPTNNDSALAFWADLMPFKLNWSARLGELRSAKLDGNDIVLAGGWQAAQLMVRQFSGKFGDGQLTASAALDVLSRRLAFTNAAQLNPQFLAGLLPDEAGKQLLQLQWRQPPAWNVTGALTLPPWTNFSLAAASRDPLLSSLKLRGELACTNAAFRHISVDRLQARFGFADWICDLPELDLEQGRTHLRLGGQVSAATGNFHARLAGDLAAASVQNLLTDTNALHGFSLLTFHQPLALNLDVAGNLRQLETLSATGHVALADFAIRGQDVDTVATDLSYSNRTAIFYRPHLTRAGGTQMFDAEKLTLDLAGERLFFEGGRGRIEPFVVGRAIGPKTFEAMEPYQFLGIPEAKVHGCVPIKQKDGDIVTDDADLWFDLVGTAPFRWRKFETTAITGRIHWWKDFIILTNATSECYGGEARGWGVFNVSPAINGTDFSFLVHGTNVDFHRMSAALWSPTNRLEGALSGTIFVTSANSEDWRTWNGSGRMQLRDGLLWDVPIFALMSPVLNAVSPGLGNSRATEATAPFQMTNGVISTESLLINAKMMRLQYAGTVDLEENVNAKVTAQLLRNTPLVGSVFSAVLWPVSKIFECHVTGTLENPSVKPIYIPKILLMPLHPIRSLEELFSPSDSSSTNAPAN